MALLRVPIVIGRVIAVIVGVVAWLVIVPLLDLWRALVRRLRG